MDINVLKNLLFEKAINRGFSSCEIYYSENSSFRVGVYKGKIEKYQNSQSGGFCFRGLYNDKMGYYFSETTDIDVESVINNAIENAEIINTDDKEFIFEGSESYSKVNTYNEELNSITVDEKINAALEMEKAALEYDSRIKPENASVSTGESRVYIANTKGLELSDKSNFIVARVSVMAEDKGETKNKDELFIGNDFSKFNPKDIGIKAAEKTISSLGGKSVKSGTMNIIIENTVFADILGCFTGNFYAENVQKGFSRLKDKIGEKIASDIITVKDNPLLEDGFSSTSFDSEGVAAYSKNVIENGILKTYLYNLKSAAKDNVKSTGNGFKAGFKGNVSTSVTNFYIEKGNKDISEIMSEMGEGLIITDVAGLHSGANAISGDFSFAAEGFKIEKGSITTPVNQITIGGNIYDILKNIADISNDLKFNGLAIGSPSVFVKNVTVGGL